MSARVSEDFVKQVNGYGLTTAHILYRLPDYKSILQTYLWQEYDVFPEFPELHKFLNHWVREIEGPLYSVQVAHRDLIKPAEFKIVGTKLLLH